MTPEQEAAERAEHARKNAETAARLAGVTHFVGDDCDPRHADIPSDAPAKGVAAGRRKRGSRNSESVPSA